MKVVEGKLTLKHKVKIGIVVSRFNEFISSKLLDGSIDCLRRHGARDEDIEVVWVPGAFEIPIVAKKMAESTKYHAIIAMGAVIKGETPHFDMVASEVAKGIAHVSLDTGVPVIFGVLTVDDLQQAIERAGVKQGNKGYEAALSAIEMANLLREV